MTLYMLCHQESNRGQGQFIDNVSPLLYELSYGMNKKGVTLV